MSVNEVKTLIDQLWTRVGSDRIDAADMRQVGKTLADLFGSTQYDNIIPSWTSGLTFQTNGTDDGEFCRLADTSGAIRLWQTLTDDNTGNSPPTDPNVTENAYWIEVSPSGATPIGEWTAGIYGEGLIIVFHNNALYKLDAATRPYNSSNIDTEITAGDWVIITGTAAANVYNNIAFTTSVPFDFLITNITGKTIDQQYDFTPDATGALDGYSSKMTLIANGNGAHVPTFTGFTKWWKSDDWDNTDTSVNDVKFFKWGSVYYYSIGSAKRAGTLAYKTWYVNVSYAAGDGIGSPQKPFSTIEAAHDAASTDDKIIISPGTYTETFTVTKSLHWFGIAGGFQETSLASGSVKLSGTITIADGVAYFKAKSIVFQHLVFAPSTAGCVADFDICAASGQITIGANCTLYASNCFVDTLSSTNGTTNLFYCSFSTIEQFTSGSFNMLQCNVNTSYDLNTGCYATMRYCRIKAFSGNTIDGNLSWLHGNTLNDPLIFNAFIPGLPYAGSIVGCLSWLPIKFTVSAGDVAVLNSTPLDIVKAPGATRHIDVRDDAYCFLDFNTTAWTNGTLIRLQNAGDGGYQKTSGSSFVQSPSDRHELMAGPLSAQQITLNQPLQISADANPAGGDSPIVIFINVKYSSIV